MGNVNRGVSRADEQIREYEREIGVLTLADRAGRPDRERYADGGEADRDRDRERDREPRNPMRDAALRAIDRLGLEARAGDRLVDLVERDTFGHDARYLAAVSNPAYERAFGTIMQFGESRSRRRVATGQGMASTIALRPAFRSPRRRS